MRTIFTSIRACLLVLVLFSFISKAQSQPVPEIEYQALVDFFEAMNGKNWPSSNKWDVNQNDLHERTWTGVTVTNGHVTGLSFNFGNISGAVPASIGNLKRLKTFYLYYGYGANLSTTDLNVFSTLDSLTSLTLRYCQLQGDIPTSWGKLANLETLDIQNNSITGLPAEFGNLSKLKTLYLSNNQLTGALITEFGALQSLQTAYLSYNKITSIPASVGNLKNITHLELQNNNITGAVIKEFEDMTALTYLNMSNNALSDVRAIFPAKVSTFALNSQTIIRNKFTYTGTDVKIDSLPRIMYYYRYGNTYNFDARNTFYLYMRGSYVHTMTPSTDGSLTIPASVLSTLKSGDDVYIYQTNGIASGSRLNFSTVEVNTPKIPDEEYEALVDFYNAMNGNNWPTANKWDISENNLHKGAWPGVSITNGHITELNFNFGNISGAVPASIRDLKHLKTFYLNNGYGSNLSTTDLNVFSALDSLTSLTLQYCQLQGNIPVSWENLKKLETLNLYYNSITGELPTEFGNLSALKTLNLQNNSITGLPASFGSLQNLESANLSYNKITAVPVTIGNLKKLVTLELNNNNMTGALIKEFENMTALTSLYLHNNKLSDVQAVLPSKVSSLNISYQTLSFNKFTYTGNDVKIDSLPKIMYYYRSGSTSNFDARNTFYIYVRGSYAYSVTPSTDGSLTIPASVLSTLKSGDDVYIYQTNGTAYGSRLNFSTVEVNTPKIPNEEYGALVDFYNAMNGSNWPTAYKWNVSENNLHEGAWPGVSITNGHITGLDFQYVYYVRGAVPASISNLKYLKTFYINGYSSDLSTTDLSVFAPLDSLTSLTLQYCNLQGSIPASWGNLVKLKTLNLQNNNITGLPATFGALQNLESANLSYNKITSVPVTIGNLKKLVTLELNNNNITGALIKEFENMTALTSLYIHNNNLSDVQAVLPSKVSYLNIGSQTLTFDTFTYTGDDVKIDSLPRIMYYYRSGGTSNFDARNTFYIYVRGSYAYSVTPSTDGSLTIPASIFSTLKSGDAVYIYQSNGTANGSRLNFSTVEIKTNKIPDEEYGALVDFYNAMNGSNWPTANKWNVSENNLHEGAWPGVSITDGHITGLNFQYVYYVRGAVPPSIGNLKHLKTFYISGYSSDLSTTDLGVFAPLDSLTSLTLQSCNLQGNIPASWGRLKKLETLYLNNNNISGTLPAQMGEMTKLKTLNMSSNKLENVDKALAGLALTSVDFSNQTINIPTIEISGSEICIELPAFCSYSITAGTGNFDAKNYFNLYINNINVTGNYAAEDGTLTFRNIDQYGIKLTDKIKITQSSGLANGTSLNYAAVSFGSPLDEDEYEILKSIFSATNGNGWMQKWDISQNNLHEKSWYGVGIKDGHVISIVLPENNLSGSLPENLGNLSRLETLNLQFNAIGGAIPAAVSKLNKLKILNLQGNKFNGTIPALSGITSLRRLSLAGNLFTGTIPAQFNQFENIETLDLSGNGFDALSTPFTYDLNRVYLDLRGQLIQQNEYLDYSADNITVVLPFINAYDDVARNYNGKFQFALQANGLTVIEATSDGKNLIFPDVNLMLIPEGAQISIWQRSGTAKDAVIRYAGIKNNSAIQIVEAEYSALVKLYQQTGGALWKETWNVSSNNIHQTKWKGIISNDGHIISIDLSDNNLQGSIPAELKQLTELRSLVLKQNKLTGEIPSELTSLPKLTHIDLSENELTGLSAAFSSGVNLKIDRQNIDMNTLELTVSSEFFDNSINRYDQTSGTFGNQSYSVTIGSYNKTISVPSTGLKLISLMSQWNIPNNQSMTLRQIGGAARNSILNYIINYLEGDANMDGAINVLDIQANINVILNQYQQYFNLGAGDLNRDNVINLLDIILLISKIQELSISGAPFENIQDPESEAILSIEDGILYLENPNQRTGAFDIRLKGIEKSQIQDLAKQQGYTLSIAGKNREAGIIGFTSGACLSRKIAIAKVSGSAEIVDALISDESATAISYTIKAPTGVHKLINDSEKGSVFNYPNPFTGNTVIKYYLPENAGKVILKVFASTGQLLRIFDHLACSAGNHEIQFLQDNLTPGIYFYQIEVYSRGQLDTYKNKMIIK